MLEDPDPFFTFGIIQRNRPSRKAPEHAKTKATTGLKPVGANSEKCFGPKRKSFPAALRRVSMATSSGLSRSNRFSLGLVYWNRSGARCGISNTVETPSRSSARPRMPFKVNSHLMLIGRFDTKPMFSHVSFARAMTTVTGFLPFIEDFKD